MTSQEEPQASAQKLEQDSAESDAFTDLGFAKGFATSLAAPLLTSTAIASGVVPAGPAGYALIGLAGVSLAVMLQQITFKKDKDDVGKPALAAALTAVSAFPSGITAALDGGVIPALATVAISYARQDNEFKSNRSIQGAFAGAVAGVALVSTSMMMPQAPEVPAQQAESHSIMHEAFAQSTASETSIKLNQDGSAIATPARAAGRLNYTITR
jgi:hypothetical protein